MEKKINLLYIENLGQRDGGDALKIGCSFVSFDSHFAVLRLTRLWGAGGIRT